MADILWLTPVAGDVLRTSSQLLAGEVPCPASKLAEVLRQADGSQCQGLLSDSGLRKEFADCLDASAKLQICEASAAELVDLFGKVLQKRIAALKSAAAKMAKKLPNGGKAIPSYSDVAAALPNGQAPGAALQQDWVIWHAAACAKYPEQVQKLQDKVLMDRLSLAAASGSEPAYGCALAEHILDNVDAYMSWEKSLAGSKAPTKSAEVLSPFDGSICDEVAARRVLSTALPPEAAMELAVQVTGGGDLKGSLAKLAARERAAAVLPRYAAPKAPKESKESQKAGSGKAPQANADPAMAGGAFGKMYAQTATQELQWQLLAYQMHPGTSLSSVSVAASSQPVATSSQVAPTAKKAKSDSKKAVSAVPSMAPKPGSFASTWTPCGASLPPGHTPYSWSHAQAQGQKADSFACTWTPVSQETPPGHTPYSWEQVLASGSAVSSGGAPPEAKKGGKAAPKAKPAATPVKASAETAADGDEGGIDAELCKLDIRCGRIEEVGRVPDADSLYLLKVNVGEPQPRQVVSSLVKHYKEGDLQKRPVVVYCNIKPGKMRGYESQAMVLAATIDKGADNEKCELLAPPDGVAEGTRLMCGSLEVGSTSESQSVKHISKVFGKVQPLLWTDGKCKATFDGRQLTLGKAAITVPSLKSAPIS